MALNQQRLVMQIGRVLLVTVCIILGSIMTLGASSPTSTIITLPDGQQIRNYNAHTLIATPTITHYLYFPLVQHADTQLANGDFETCDQTGWDTGQGPFAGHGSGLPQAVVSFEESCRARIGDPSAQNGAIPVGSGIFAQTFEVDKRYLKFRYRILTNDIIRGAQTGRYFDTFEVSLNTPPDQISDSERNNKGCSTTLLNPTGIITPSNKGLVLCGGHNGSETDAGTLRDLGWKEVTLDMQNFQQENITLYFALWSREYEPDRYNDQALYNTIVYIDDVQLAPLCQSLHPPLGGPPVNLEVKITSPENCDTNLGPSATIRGTYSGDLSGKEIWILVYPELALKYYIQSHDACGQRPAEANQGQWITRAFFGGPVQQYDVIAVVTEVGSPASVSFKEQLKKQCDENDLPGLPGDELPAGITEMDTITVQAGGR
jgi:hypothetical protein